MRLQDEAAQLVSYLVSPQGGDSILDVCAGSGGKASHLAALMKNKGRIVALDRDTEKIAHLNKDTLRMGISIIETQQADLSRPLSMEFLENFDHVLVDAPCSGTGTLGRNPEIKWRLRASDMNTFSKTQLSILSNAAGAVKKNGRLIYSTCSVLPDENDEVIRQFLMNNSQFSVEAPPEAVSASLADSRGFFRTYPHRHNMDGFFGAILHRRI